MVIILFNKDKHTFCKETRTFGVNEKDTTFSTKYSIKNPKTGNSVDFSFDHSTGCEFDPETKWIYKSQCGLTLQISQDPEITKNRADSYLNHKIGGNL